MEDETDKFEIRKAKLQTYLTERPDNGLPGAVVDEFMVNVVSDWRKPRYALPSLEYLSPWKITFTTGYALVTLAVLALPSYQLWHAYSSGQGLDVSPSGFIIPAVLFLVLAIGAATLLRRAALCLSLRRQARQETVIAEYDLPFSPVEAGVIIDAYSNSNEVAAVFQQLLVKGIIWLDSWTASEQ